MRFYIHSPEESKNFRLFTTPFFCGTEPVAPDETLFPTEIDYSLFPKNSQRLFILFGITEYRQILNMSYLTLLLNSKTRRITLDRTREVIAEIFYGENGRDLQDLAVTDSAQIRDTFPKVMFLGDKKIEIDARIKDLLKAPVKKFYYRFNSRNKKFIFSRPWIKNLYHLYNLLVFLPDEYSVNVLNAKVGMKELFDSFKTIIATEKIEEDFTKVSMHDPLAYIAMRLKERMDELDEKSRLLLKRRFTDRMDMKTIGSENSISGERVRQIVVSFIRKAKKEFVPLEPKLREHILNQLIKKTVPLETKFLARPSLDSVTFINMLTAIYPALPVAIQRPYLAQNIYREDNPLYAIYVKLKAYLKNKDRVPVSIIMNDFSFLKDWDKVNLFKIAFSVTFFKISEEKGTYYIRGRLNLPEMAENILWRSDGPMHLKELIKSVKSTYGRVYNDLKVSLCHIRMNDNVMQLDKELFGVEKHLSVQGDQLGSLLKKAAGFLQKENKMVDASVIFTELKPEFPMLRSKYELVHILRKSDEIKDLGFFCFIHKSTNLKNRILVNDLLIEVLKKNNNVMSAAELLNEINKYRVVSVTGFSSKLNNVGFLDAYGGNFYGLIETREENIKRLSGNPLFISKVLIEKGFPESRFSDLEKIFKGFDLDKIVEVINSDDSFVLFPHPKNDKDRLILSKNWRRNKLFYIILNAQKKPISMDEFQKFTQPLGHDANMLTKINFYALGLDYFNGYAWVKHKIVLPPGRKRRSKLPENN